MAKGRPLGSKNLVVDEVRLELTRCKKCGSANRGKYLNRRVHLWSGKDANGRPYTRIVRRRTKCLDCGQLRDDTEYLADDERN
jgi:hypothetical protein